VGSAAGEAPTCASGVVLELGLGLALGVGEGLGDWLGMVSLGSGAVGPGVTVEPCESKPIAPTAAPLAMAAEPIARTSTSASD
jgi:hypothetical protein